MKLSSLTNPSENLQRKMRFFIDYFHFVNEYLGKLPEIFFDNPESLTDKIIFQIKTNPEYGRQYIINHFCNLQIFYANPQFTKSEIYIKVSALIAEYLRSNQKVIEWLPDHPELLSSLLELRTEYNETLFDDIISTLYKCIQCPHTLEHHSYDIKFCTHILVTLYRFKNYSEKSINSFISRILSKNIDVFPLPVKYVNVDKTESLRQSAKEFISKNDFKQQFDGFRNLFETIEIQAGYFIYSIDNCLLHDDLKSTFRVTFDSVTFISPLHPELSQLKENLANRDEKYNDKKILEIFFGDNKLLAYLKLNYENPLDRKEDAFKIINREVTQLNEYISESLTVNRNNFLFVREFELNEWNANIDYTNSKGVALDNQHYQKAKNNVFERLRSIQSTTKDEILLNEKLFLNAYINQASLFWSYLESLFFILSLKADRIQKKPQKLF